MKCLYRALIAIAIPFGGAGCLIILRYALAPLWRLIGKYWDWVSDTFHDDFWELLFAVTPVCALVFAIIAFILCLAGAE